MKTELARRAKAFAKKTDRTFTELVEDAIADFLKKGTGKSVALPEIPVVTGTTTYPAGGLKQLVEELDLEDDNRRMGR